MFDRAFFTRLPTRIKRAGLALGAISVFALLLPAGQTLARFTDSQALSTDQSITTGQLSIEAVPNSLSAELRSYQAAPSSKTRTFGGGVTCSPGSGKVAYVCQFGERQLEHLIMSGGDEVRVNQRFITHGEGEIEDLATGEVHQLAPGTLYLLNDHDKHKVRVRKEIRCVCVFNPPVTGREVHDENGVYPLITEDA